MNKKDNEFKTLSKNKSDFTMFLDLYIKFINYFPFMFIVNLEINNLKSFVNLTSLILPQLQLPNDINTDVAT